MGRPKIKDIDNAIDLDKVKLPEEVVLETKILEPKEKVKATSKNNTAKKIERKNEKSKRYLDLSKLVDKSKSYRLKEAVSLIKKTATTKFDATIEVHLNLNVDPSKQEQQIRTTTTLPKSNGKKTTVLVFGTKDPKIVKDTGTIFGDDDTLVEIEKGKINFEKVVASPEWMPKLAKVAKILGPKGLMPNPKSGTVSSEPEKVAAKLNSGMLELKTETSPIIHVSIGKASFKEQDLEENIKSLVESVKAAKPAELKKELISSIYLTSTMGPSVKVLLTAN